VAAAGLTTAATLPAQVEASEPPEARGLRRDDVRLLVSRVDVGRIEHGHFRELPRWLLPGDVLVVNTSGTLNAALMARVGRETRSRETRSPETGSPAIVHLSTRLPGGYWVVEIRGPGPVASVPWRHAHAGMTLDLEGGGRVSVLAPYPFDGRFDAESRLWLAALDLPEPWLPYLERVGRPIRYDYVPVDWPASFYQTVFGLEPGSAEMPSAGRPFTAELVTRLVSAGIQIAPVLLHTGVASLEDHEPPYEEVFRVSSDTAERVTAARLAGRRVIAVGTTVVRALETVTDERGITSPGEGWTGAVIGPDRPVRAVTGMITGLHEPRATHVALVEQVLAAAGSRSPSADLARAYDEAQGAGYLWHEFGDAHLIVGGRSGRFPT
jgi:S-adenosylmethionine:tRNA ribosyltransferase-isomerase